MEDISAYQVAHVRQFFFLKKPRRRQHIGEIFHFHFTYFLFFGQFLETCQGPTSDAAMRRREKKKRHGSSRVLSHIAGRRWKLERMSERSVGAC